ncbi:MAG: hypothetical protein V5A64_03390 [Candidatus Thermoplasmatota archaeon]
MIKKRCLKKDERGQVLGLPMYLIIIMIVAVAVIAAVIFMMPQGSKQIDAQVTQGSLIDLSGDGEISGNPSDNIIIKVFTKDERADPISGATITLTGAGVAYEDTTNDAGEVSIDPTSISAELSSNKNDDYISMTIKASGFEDYKDDQAIHVVRV